MALITLSRNGKPLYRVRWNYHRDPVTGKSVYDQREFRRKTDAVRFERSVKPGATNETERITVAELAVEWVTRFVAASDPTSGKRYCSKRTEVDYRLQLKMRIIPQLGHMKVSRLTPRILGDWQQQMLMDGTSAHTANKTLRVFKSMMAWGRGAPGLHDNRASLDIKALRQSDAEPPRPYTPQEVEHIANSCERLLDKTLILTAAYSGLRWSELAALEWSDIDLDSGQIVLRRSLDIDRTTRSTKSDRVRTVPVLKPGRDALRIWKLASPPTDLVFPDANGNALARNWHRHDTTTDEITSSDRNLGRIRKVSGIHVEMHQLRDTYASILIQSGVDIAELTLWLGHRSIQTTLRRYGGLFDSVKASRVSKADAFLADLQA